VHSIAGSWFRPEVMRSLEQHRKMDTQPVTTALGAVFRILAELGRSARRSELHQDRRRPERLLSHETRTRGATSGNAEAERRGA